MNFFIIFRHEIIDLKIALGIYLSRCWSFHRIKMNSIELKWSKIDGQNGRPSMFIDQELAGIDTCAPVLVRYSYEHPSSVASPVAITRMTNNYNDANNFQRVNNFLINFYFNKT